MAALDDESVFGAKPKPSLTHEIGQNIDDLSAPELAERIALLRSEIDRLEKAIEFSSSDPRGCRLGLQNLTHRGFSPRRADEFADPRASR